MPSLAFFTTYALLVLFWAEIYYQASLAFVLVVLFTFLNCIWYCKFVMLWPDFHFDHVLQARAVSTDGLRPSFYTINAVVYVIQVKNLAHDCTFVKIVGLTYFYVQPVQPVHNIYCFS